MPLKGVVTFEVEDMNAVVCKEIHLRRGDGSEAPTAEEPFLPILPVGW
jgi:hypothetical protein